jgi:tetratricopeptide (TPR) repeat protein
MRYSALLVAALILGGRSALAADADTCRMPGDSDRRIAACTRLSDDSGLSAAMRALALTSRGLAREEKGDVKRAMVDYDEAIRLDPRSANARLFRSSLFRNAANYDRAIEDLSEAIRIDPGAALFYTRRGMSYYAKHDYERAIADFTESLRLSPNNIDAIWGRGQANSYAGHNGRAIADYTEAIRIEPHAPRGYVARALVYQS